MLTPSGIVKVIYLSFVRVEDVGHTKVEELQHQQTFSDDSAAESSPRTGVVKNLMNEDDIKASYALDTPVCLNIYFVSLRMMNTTFICLD